MKIGVVGVGWWGKNIVNTLESSETVDRVVVYDEQMEAYEAFQNNKKIDYANSLESLLADPSIIGVCLTTPPPTHYELSKRILLAGKHLLVEKPPARQISQIHELGMIAESKKLVYMLDALYLFIEPVQKIKEILNSGELKNIRYIQMFRIGDELRRVNAGIQRIRKTMFAKGIDVVEDLFFHDAAILLYLFGDFDFSSSEKLYLYDPSFCDTSRIRLMANGVPVELTLSWTLAGRRRGMVIYDEEIMVEYDGLKSKNQLTKYHLTENRQENFNFSQVAPLGALLDFFIGCVAGKHANPFGCAFMEKITSVWRTISDEH